MRAKEEKLDASGVFLPNTFPPHLTNDFLIYIITMLKNITINSLIIVFS
jgi:hypothetical protein